MCDLLHLDKQCSPRGRFGKLARFPNNKIRFGKLARFPNNKICFGKLARFPKKKTKCFGKLSRFPKSKKSLSFFVFQKTKFVSFINILHHTEHY